MLESVSAKPAYQTAVNILRKIMVDVPHIDDPKRERSVPSRLMLLDADGSVRDAPYPLLKRMYERMVRHQTTGWPRGVPWMPKL